MQQQQQMQPEVYQDEYGNEVYMDQMQGAPNMEPSDATNALVSAPPLAQSPSAFAPPQQYLMAVLRRRFRKSSASTRTSTRECTS